MSTARTYFVEPVTINDIAGFECWCYKGGEFCGKRFFKDQGAAEQYGDDWKHAVLVDRGA